MTGRRFAVTRRARLSECAPDGRLRLDAVACWLQDVAADDVREAGLTEDDGVWMVRRTVVEVSGWPRLGDEVEVTTWASGTGGAVAERRTSLGGMVEATALWTCTDRTSFRPMRMTERFWAVFGESSGGARVKARLSHGDPPPSAGRRPWTLRFTDLDRVGHVNNAAYFAAVEEVLAGDTPPRRVEMEYRGGLRPESDVSLLTTPAPSGSSRGAWSPRQRLGSDGN